MSRIVAVIDALAPAGQQGLISIDGPPLPIPPELDGGALRSALPRLTLTPLEDGVGKTMERFLTLHARGELDLSDLTD